MVQIIQKTQDVIELSTDQLQTIIGPIEPIHPDNAFKEIHRACTEHDSKMRGSGKMTGERNVEHLQFLNGLREKLNRMHLIGEIIHNLRIVNDGDKERGVE